ncbi:MAG: GNAT family N-acetyltransferase [Bacteroidota bacterium]
MITESYKLIEVTDKQTEKLFLYGVYHIYDNDDNWVPTLDIDIKNHFNIKKNPLLIDGKAKRWIIVDSSSKVLGRIAAFFHPDKADVYGMVTGGVGFYESIDNLEVSYLLFNTAINWLKEFGIEAVDGPINLGENFNNWGLLYDGYVQPMYGMQYHPKYYKKQFEEFGFKIFYKQYSFRMNTNNVPDRMFRIGKWVDEKKRFRARHFKFSEKVDFSNDLADAFNVIWSSFKKDFTSITGDDILKMLEEAKFILDPKLVWIVYDGSKPISLAIIIPDVNQLIKRIDGKLSFSNIIKLLYYKRKNPINRVRSLVIGVAPEYQKHGIEALIFYKINKVFNKSQYKEIEFSWIGDYNTKMLRTIGDIGPKKVSTHVTYRYLLDRKKEFVRYPIDN